MEPKIELLVFDWEGTLLDPFVHIRESVDSATEALGLPAIDPHTTFCERPRDPLPLIESLFPDVDRAIKAALLEQLNYFLFSLPSEPTLFPGAKDLLTQCQSAGYFLAIATGESRRGLNAMLDALKMTEFFAITRCGDEVASKPDPQILIEIMTDLNMTPEQTLMIGDTSVDVHCAHNAGVKCIAIAQGTHSAEALEASKPSMLLPDLKALATYLNLTNP